MNRETAPPPDKTSSGMMVYAVLGVLLAVLLIGAGSYFWLSGGSPVRSMIGGPFTLQDGNGKTVTDRDFRGKYMLVYFGYTFCPDVCPTTLNAVADAVEKLGPKGERVQPLFITVDPKRDTPDAVRQYAAAFGPRVIGLTGTPEQVAAAARTYRVYYKEHRPAAGSSDYTVDHSSILYLMGPDGTFLAPIRAEGSGEEIAAAIARQMS